MPIAFLLAVYAAVFAPEIGPELAGWERPAPPVESGYADHHGMAAARLHVPDTMEPGFPALKHRMPVAQGNRIRARASIWPEQVRDGYGAYISVSYYKADGTRISYDQSSPAQQEGAWNKATLSGIAPEGTETMEFFLLLNGHGTAWFTAPELHQEPAPVSPPLTGEATLTLAKEPLSSPFLGFGFEDDGWFYDAVNAGHGVDAADAALREERIAALAPDWVRMFFWYKDWNPSMDGETFDWDNDAMQSKYRALEVYQRLGARVLLCGVEWSIPEPFGAPGKLARAWGALAEHLIRDKGFTCVQQWTLTNEPNLSYVRHGGTWETYVETHLQTKAEFERRGLDIAIVGSDDTNGGLPWFEQCLEDDRYFDASDLLASHLYLREDARDIAPLFFAERLEPLAGRKPFVVAEFGFHDGRAQGPMINPVMEEDAYATWTMRFVTEGLNAGVSGFSIWCLHEVFYPFDARMGYGLWNFKNRDWSLRPVYHAWKSLLDHTKPGDPVFPARSSHPGRVEGVRVGEGVFWVNDTAQPVALRILPREGSEVKVDAAPGGWGWTPLAP
ncbi:MAG: hypothetical protein GC168_17490 [Candidatus Hydrogenedens sp.]|nr:hypothetical protein [Candidatus Hydrogenedens sp.]